jgi:hypothetical protein
MKIRPTPALVLAVLALLVALGGTSYAAGLARGSVTSTHLANGTIRSIDVRDGSLTGADLKSRSIPASKLSRTCPRGAVRALGGCVALKPQKAATHQQALARCGALGGRVPTVADLRYLRTVPGLQWAGGDLADYEHANATTVSGNVHQPVAVDAQFNNYGDASTFPAHFHCITSP